ncbi:hypothetical protein E0500_019660 [Streptomyces sp. KM273126]|uniref:hypothetical protein n=1 Tax=Streptomyces sp. KM273126 TaxID=2545247 RepID=UPI00103E5E9B|nr:hypothetical protein [Streptomyces sp. KM273126]MBA2809551.1 hypothetical protein [Streptomyces sp. KM273126]
MSAVPPLTTTGFPAAADWWRQRCSIIDWHHNTEDDIRWPGLIEWLPSFAAHSNRRVREQVCLPVFPQVPADVMQAPVRLLGRTAPRHHPAALTARPGCRPPPNRTSAVPR